MWLISCLILEGGLSATGSVVGVSHMEWMPRGVWTRRSLRRISGIIVSLSTKTLGMCLASVSWSRWTADWADCILTLSTNYVIMDSSCTLWCLTLLNSLKKWTGTTAPSRNNSVKFWTELFINGLQRKCLCCCCQHLLALMFWRNQSWDRLQGQRNCFQNWLQLTGLF